MRGESRHRYLATCVENGPIEAEIFGTLHSFGDYPALKIGGKRGVALIPGELYWLKNQGELFKELDRIEGALEHHHRDAGFYRTPVQFGITETGRVRCGWAYVWWGDLPRMTKRIREGGWRGIGVERAALVLH
jgi:hypothetical protein